jgi:DNA adenine methylase
MAADIRKLFPKHTRYVEPFFGSGAVMLAGDGEGVAEYANDLDGELTNFWRTLQHANLFHDFHRLVDCCGMSKIEFANAKAKMEQLASMWPDARIPAGVERVKRAAWFFIQNRQSRQALGRDFATPTSRLRRNMNEQVSAWLTAVEGLPEFHARLKRVEIWGDQAAIVIKKLDSAETLFYCDPPYVHETRSTTGEYKHEMTKADHIELLNVLAGIKGKFVLSGYRCDLYDDFARPRIWRRKDFDLPNNASSAGTKERKIECCWMNY